MAQEKVTLNWHSYSDHLRNMMQNLMESNLSADVTLVCDDKTKLKAHKFMLNSCSPIFQSIINDFSPTENSIIYLKGILSNEMNSILQFMYLGQASVQYNRINKFLDVAAAFEIMGISGHEDFNTNKKKLDDGNFNFISFNNEESSDLKPIDSNHPSMATATTPQKSEQTLYLKQLENVSIPLTPIGVKEETGDTLSKMRRIKKEYPCHKCISQFKKKSHLVQHIQSVHEGIRYSCKQCVQTYSWKSALTKHILVAHGGPSPKYECNDCNLTFTQKDTLVLHNKHFH